MKKRFLALLVSLAIAPLLLGNGAVRAASANLITRPSVETPSASDPSMPDGWDTDQWGTNTATFKYVTTTGYAGTHSLKINMTKYTSGSTSWFFDPVAVAANTSYTYSDYYKATVYTEALAKFIDAQGHTTYAYLGLIAPSSGWKQWTATFTTPANVVSMTVMHTLSEMGILQTDSFSLKASPVSNEQIAITAPTAGATISCTTSLTAKLTGTTGIQGGVQFQVDGVSVGSPVTKSPYTLSWNSSTVLDGAHTITAVVTDTMGNVKTTAPVSVTVANDPPAVPAGNLFANGSAERALCGNASLPDNFTADSYGTNNAQLTYLNTGHTGSHSVKVSMTSRTDGDGKWIPDPVAVQPNSLYTYTEYYQADATDDEILVKYFHTDGSTSYEYIANPANSPSTWAKFSVTITTYADTAYLTIMHTLDSTGSVTLDDISLVPYTPTGFNRGLVSVTFDDGWLSTYQNALPIMNQYGLKGTWYIIPDYNGVNPNAMTTAQVMDVKNQGQELASHTMDHVDLTQLSPADLQFQVQQSQQVMQATYGVPINGFASPFGLYNDATIASIKQYYNYNRTVDVGYNSKDNFSTYYIKVQNVTSDTSTATVQEWIDQAKATNTWLVLVYHDIGAAEQYNFNYPTADFATNMQAVVNSGLTVLPMEQALAEIQAQL